MGEAVLTLARAAATGTPDDADSIFNKASVQLALLLLHHPAEYPAVLRESSESVAAAVTVTVLYLAALEQVGRIADALQTCDIAIASGRPEPAQQAGITLGRLLRIYEDIPNSRAALSRLAESTTLTPTGDRTQA